MKYHIHRLCPLFNENDGTERIDASSVLRSNRPSWQRVSTNSDRRYKT